MRPVRLPGSEPKRQKYNATAIVIDGIRFASLKEAKRYSELLLLVKAGEIHGLTLQPRYDLKVLGVQSSTIGIYRADFAYCECRCREQCLLSRVVVEDVKGFKTPLYRLKKKFVEAQYGIHIREV